MGHLTHKLYTGNVHAIYCILLDVHIVLYVLYCNAERIYMQVLVHFEHSKHPLSIFNNFIRSTVKAGNKEAEPNFYGKLYL